MDPWVAVWPLHSSVDGQSYLGYPLTRTTQFGRDASRFFHLEANDKARITAGITEAHHNRQQ